MAKKTITRNSNNGSINDSFFIPEKYQDWFFVGLIILSVFIFFGSAIFGNGFLNSDNLAANSMDTFIKEANEKGEFPLWIPYIFGGMPAYGSLLLTGDRWWDIAPQQPWAQ